VSAMSKLAADGPPQESSPGDARLATQRRRDENLARIGRVIVVMSGKGGVGKSTVATGLAVALARLGRRTGLLDIDFHGPSVPVLLGLAGGLPAFDGEALRPLEPAPNLRVMSLGLLLSGADDAVIWRGPMKIGVINQLLGDVAWGDLDFLVLDCPPGTGDEPLSVAQAVPTAEVVLVATPQEVAMADVRKAATFCRTLRLHVLGLVETMAALVCPGCGKTVALFRRAAGAAPEGVPLLGEIPFDPLLQEACDEGRLAAFLAEGGPTARRFMELAAMLGAERPEATETGQQSEGSNE